MGVTLKSDFRFQISDFRRGEWSLKQISDFRFQISDFRRKGVEVLEALGYTLARFQISDFRKESRLELHFS